LPSRGRPPSLSALAQRAARATRRGPSTGEPDLQADQGVAVAAGFDALEGLVEGEPGVLADHWARHDLGRAVRRAGLEGEGPLDEADLAEQVLRRLGEVEELPRPPEAGLARDLADGRVAQVLVDPDAADDRPEGPLGLRLVAEQQVAQLAFEVLEHEHAD